MSFKKNTEPYVQFVCGYDINPKLLIINPKFGELIQKKLFDPNSANLGKWLRNLIELRAE